MSVGLVIVRTIEIMVPFLVLFALDAVSLLVLVFYPVACISVADNVTQVSFIPISDALLQGSDLLAESPHGLWQWSRS
jgi:hypothetical protein